MKVRHDFETKVKEQPRYNTQLTQLQIQRLNNKEPKKCQKIFCALGLLEGFNINSCLIFDGINQKKDKKGDIYVLLFDESLHVIQQLKKKQLDIQAILELSYKFK